MYFVLAREEGNAVNLRSLPVIVLPGIMGTRLRLAERPDWDPNDDFAMLEWVTSIDATDRRKLLHHKTHATVLTEGNYTDEENARGWGSLATAFYGDILRTLQTELDTSGSFSFPVYAFGYDWRQNNASSAELLRAFAADVLRREDASEVVFVTHSMGGYVVREAVRHEWMRNATLGVVHIAQPTGGAPVVYRRCLDGLGLGTDGWKMGALMGLRARDAFHLFSALPAALQLLPYDQTKHGASPAHATWVKRRAVGGDTSEAWGAFPDLGGTLQLYKHQHHPPSLAPEFLRPDLRRGELANAAGLLEPSISGGKRSRADRVLHVERQKVHARWRSSAVAFSRCKQILRPMDRSSRSSATLASLRSTAQTCRENPASCRSR
jgi:hypothetical protein